jgi:cell division protein FtsW
MSPDRAVDKVFLVIVGALLFSGFVIFISASLGTLASNQDKFTNLLISQLGFGLALGGIAMFVTSRIKYVFWRKYAFWIFLFSIALSLLVFVPGIGMEHGGAQRWLDLGFTTFQPGELLKFGVTVYLAAWFTFVKKRIQSMYFGLYPLMAMLGIAGGLLLAQPDTGTFLIAAAAGTAMFIAAGARGRELLLLIVLGVLLLGVLAFFRPYVMDRFTTLFNHDDFQGSGYQVRQSLIAIGSGGLFGQGLGQSVQKFNFLPEAHGDSVFAVASEEFGFIGSSFLIILYILFALRGLWIAARAPDRFGGLLAVGLVILIVSQSFINIASMLAVAPLTGVPLIFVSQGGTALLIAMIEVGILLNISRYRRL